MTMSFSATQVVIPATGINPTQTVATICGYDETRICLWVSVWFQSSNFVNQAGTPGTFAPFQLNRYWHGDAVKQAFNCYSLPTVSSQATTIWIAPAMAPAVLTNGALTALGYLLTQASSNFPTYLVVWQSFEDNAKINNDCQGVVDQVTGHVVYPENCKGKQKNPLLYAQVASMLDRQARQEIKPERRNPWIFNTAFLLNGKNSSANSEEDDNDSNAALPGA